MYETLIRSLIAQEERPSLPENVIEVYEKVEKIHTFRDILENTDDIRHRRFLSIISNANTELDRQFENVRNQVKVTTPIYNSEEDFI